MEFSDPALGQRDRSHSSEDHSYRYSQKRETSNSGFHSMNALEHKRISCQSDVHEAVNEGEVESNQEQNRFCNEHSDRSCQVLLHQLLEINLDFLLFGMN